MAANRFRVLILSLGLLGVLPLPAVLAAETHCPFSAPGLVVETVTAESAAFRAGLMPGDRLISWCRASEARETAPREEIFVPCSTG